METLTKYDENQPRADDGKWTAGGSSNPLLKPKTDAEIAHVKERHNVVVAHLESLVHDNSHIDESIRKQHAETVSRVCDYMTVPMLEKLKTHLGDVALYHDHNTLTAAIAPQLAEQSKELAGAFVYQSSERSGTLHMDGHDEVETRGIYAHEMAHAIDFGHWISNQQQWKDAYHAEINLPHSPLSEYAKKSPSEGFAEYVRLMVTSPREAREFSQCRAVMQNLGYV